MVYQWGLDQHIVLREQYDPTCYLQPRNTLLAHSQEKRDYQIIGELILEARRGNSLLFIIPHM
jgi:hypothetical protein